ncbi:hypothetical protein DFH06DRAFT_337664 [Mycena polygramma]|nr:hypothetical protein DFH06DRAFT_337664 [Mycena polygramma]
MPKSKSCCSECGALSAPVVTEEVAAFVDVAPESRHHGLLNSNEPPEGSDMPFIHSVVLETDEHLKRLDDDIAKLQKTLKQLKEARMSLSRYRAQNRAILSPLRRLPTEVLGEIFSWTSPTVTDRRVRDKLDVGASPWVLTHINARWRAIALATPSLWSLIVIAYSEEYDAASAYSLASTEAHLQRSQTHTLKIHFHSSPDADSDAQIRMFDLLSRHASRWEELSLGLTGDLVPSLLALRDRIPSLRRLWIYWNEEEFARVASIDVFETAPCLLDAGVFNEYRFISYALPVHQLTRYEMDCSWQTHMAILKQATKLVEARIDVDFQDGPQWPDPDGSIDLPALQRLHVSDAEVLDYLQVSALEELSLWVDVDTSDLTHLDCLLDRSACALRYLCLDGVPDAYSTTRILRRLSHLTELAVLATETEASSEVNDLISTLTLDGASVVVAPQLRGVSVGCVDLEIEDPIDFRLFLEMLKSRWNADGCALQTAALASKEAGRPDDATLQGLNALRSLGFNFSATEGEEAAAQVRCWTFETNWESSAHCRTSQYSLRLACSHTPHRGLGSMNP